MGALDETRARRAVSPETQPEWPSGWEFTAPLVDDESHFAVYNDNGAIRVALGVADSDSGDDDVLVDATGIAWKEVPAGGEHTPVTTKERWVRWKRAEHHAVRAALSGIDWRLAQVDGAWQSDDGAAHIDLVAALAAIPVDSEAAPRPPAILPRAAVRVPASLTAGA